MYVGILQVNHKSEWGTVCDDGWNTRNTRVVCRQLGYQHGIAKHLGPGSGRIWLDDVVCSGKENSIVNCRHAGWGVENCDHDEDIGVACFTGKKVPPSLSIVQHPLNTWTRCSVLIERIFIHEVFPLRTFTRTFRRY